jgi:hypothetical protein
MELQRILEVAPAVADLTGFIRLEIVQVGRALRFADQIEQFLAG